MNMNAKTKLPMYIAVQIENTDGERRTWLTLPASKKQFAAALERIGADHGNFSISCYNCRVPAFGRYRMMETPLNKVNHLAARLQKLDSEQVVKLCAIADSDMYFEYVEPLIDYTYNSGAYTLIPGVCDEEALGRLYLDSPGHKIDGVINREFIDRRDYGKKLAACQDGQFTALGYVTSINNWGRDAEPRRVPDTLNLKGYLGEDLYGEWGDGDVI